jgi:hypothetical protein
VIKKEARKFLSYKDLTIEIQCMCNVKTKVIEKTGTISKSFGKYLANIPGKQGRTECIHHYGCRCAFL